MFLRRFCPWPISPSILRAFAGLLLGLCGLVLAYQELLYEEVEAVRLQGGIPIGVQEFSLFEGDSCFGAGLMRIDDTEGYWQVELEAAASFSFLGNTQLFGLEGRAAFNGLGQLGASTLRISHDQVFLLVGTRSVYPIHISMELIAGEFKKKHEWEIPGPLTLLPSSELEGTLELRYPLSRSPELQQRRSLLELFQNGSLQGLKLVRGERCPQPYTPFVLDPILESFRGALFP